EELSSPLRGALQRKKWLRCTVCCPTPRRFSKSATTGRLKVDMPRRIVILGRDPQRCTELQNILQDRVADQVLTASEKGLPRIGKSDTVLITSETKDTAIVYQHVVNNVEEQRQRAELLRQLIRL